MRAQGAHGFQLSNSCDGRRSTFIVHDNMTATLNKPAGTHQAAPMTERHGHTEQPGHRSHHVHGLPGPHRSRTGPTSRARRESEYFLAPNRSGDGAERLETSKSDAQSHTSFASHLSSAETATTCARDANLRQITSTFVRHVGPRKPSLAFPIFSRARIANVFGRCFARNFTKRNLGSFRRYRYESVSYTHLTLPTKA